MHMLQCISFSSFRGEVIRLLQCKFNYPNDQYMHVSDILIMITLLSLDLASDRVVVMEIWATSEIIGSRSPAEYNPI
jgi:hypothetical protein